jgi:hypothetical protein
MKQLLRHLCRYAVLFSLVLVIGCVSAWGHECSLSRTNMSCELTIDRKSPVAPPTVQMYSGQTLKIVLDNPLPFERYFLDFTTGQATLTPDVTASIVQGLVPDLSKFQGLTAQIALANPPKVEATCDYESLAKAPLPDTNQVIRALPMFVACFQDLGTKALQAYKDIEPFVAPDSLVPTDQQTINVWAPTFYADQSSSVTKDIDAYDNAEFIVSSKISAMSKVAITPPTLPTPTAPKPPPPAYYNAQDQVIVTDLTDVQKVVDAITADLLGYKQRLKDLGSCGYNSVADASGQCSQRSEIEISSRPDEANIYKGMVTRTITYSLDALNLVSYSQQAAPNPTNKKALATIAINFGDSPKNPFTAVFTALRWEGSAGVFFSMIPDRTFSVSPTYSIGSGGPTVTDNTIKESAPRPTPLPFAAANYRITNDFPTRWKSNVYWTAAIGINPNTTVAEYATGFSFSWRTIMFSGLCHFGHDIHLTQGFTQTTDLGPSFTGTIPTKSYWTEAFAFGISVRVPAIAGR